MFVYFESKKRKLQKRRKNEYRCDERLKTKTEESTGLVYWVGRGTGTHKDRDEVNKHEDSECHG
jgi:hypothetical protein